MLEVRCAVEVVEDRERRGPGRLTGTIVPFGRVMSDPGRQREIFAPGSVTTPSNGVRLLLEHRGRQVMRITPRIDASGVHVDQVLPDTAEGREAARLVRAGERRGLSAEFHALRETTTRGVREVTESMLVGAALAKRPSYAPHTPVEVRGAAGDLEFWT